MCVSLPEKSSSRRHPRGGLHGSGAFTLVELLVSMTVLSILMLLVTQIIGQVQRTWLQSNSRVAQFREARTAYDLLTTNLRQAVLNPYWDTDSGGLSADSTADRQNQIPTKYVRKSDLQFISGKAVDLVQGVDNNSKDKGHLPYHAVFFQATLGVTQTSDYERLQSLLCARGYFVLYGDDAAYRPPFVTTASNRFRLMEYSPTSEQNAIYANALAKKAPTDWFKDAGIPVDRSTEGTTSAASSAALIRGFTRPVAENIVALIIAPRVSDQQAVSAGKDPHWIAPNFAYDSTAVANATGTAPQGTQHLLPPLLDVIMVAIDEVSQDRFGVNEASQLQSLAPFTDAARLNLGQTSLNATDIKALEDFMVNKKVNFRVFSSTIEIRGARWSL